MKKEKISFLSKKKSYILPSVYSDQYGLSNYKPLGSITFYFKTEILEDSNDSFDFAGGSDGKESVCYAADPRLIPGSGRPPGEGNGNPLQYSCL